MLGPNQTLLVEALESGQYVQGTGHLEPEPGCYCCLGLACVIARQNGITINMNESSDRIFGHNLKSQNSVKDWFGFYNETGGAKTGIRMCLTELNDSEHYTFQEIAAHLRKYPGLYFSEPK